MITEGQLVKNIRELRQIRPRKDWVVLTKRQVLGQTPKITFLPYFKPAFAGLITVFVLLGVFSFAQNSLPGDILYPIKKITERSRAIFVSQVQKPKMNLELANKRLEELTRIAETNQVKKLAPALEEYQASVAEAAKNLAKVAATTSDPLVMKKIAEQTQKFEENKERLARTYGIAGLEVEEESNPTKVVVEWLIQDLEKRTLSEEQELLFKEAKEYYETGDYNQALEKILFLSYQ